MVNTLKPQFFALDQDTQSMAYLLGGESIFTCSDIIKSQSKDGSDGNLIFTATWIIYAGDGL